MKKLTMKSVDLTQSNIEKIAELFPNVITEVRDEQGNIKRAVDFDLLKQELSDVLVEGEKERYQLTWPGKKQAILIANTPINKTLRPVKEESVDWEKTQNLYIEGDNLEVLKLLQESYLNKIKCIYIDPPYNTGNDFIYKDDFKESTEEYFEVSGQIDHYRNRLVSNPSSNGRFHSDWITMIYPRLKLARNLLTEDGAIFISIDDNEVFNLRKICDEIFGSDNFIAQFVWAAGRKNDSRFVSVSHEYIVCYAKNKQYLSDNAIRWRKKKEGLNEIYSIYDSLVKKYGSNYSKIEEELKKWYKSLPENHPSKSHSHYCKVDEKGIFFPADISWPGGGGPKYEVLHPITKKPVKVPSRGWMFSNIEKMLEAINEGRVYFGEDENQVPCIKSYLKDKEYEVPYSVFYKDGRASTKRLRALFGADIFENPKDEYVLKDIISFCNTENSIILDFFSGSATTAHAVMQLNAEDGGNRRYIMVQLPEPTPEDSEAYKAGYKNICEIGKERIRRAAKKIKEETGADIDYGFRVFRVDSSNMKDVYYTPDKLNQKDLLDLVSNVKEDRTSEDLLIQVMLELGLELSLPMETKQIEGKTVHYVDGNALVACFDDNVPESVIRQIAKDQPLRVVFRDSSFADDSARINVEELFKMLSPITDVRVL